MEPYEHTGLPPIERLETPGAANLISMMGILTCALLFIIN
jgi:hypothetical protein